MSLTSFEIRNYLMQPAKRDHFIDYFEHHFIFSQHEAGMHVLGQFRVIDNPDHFVWIRGYPDRASRFKSLNTFYNSPYWYARRPLTNAMMIDSSHVHLIKPLGGEVNLTGEHTPHSIAQQLADSTISIDTGVFGIDFYHAEPEKSEQVAIQLREKYQTTGIQVRGIFAADTLPNDFTRHPVIQNAGDFVIISAYESEAVYRQQKASIGEVGVSKTEESLLLTPTLRSPMRW